MKQEHNVNNKIKSHRINLILLNGEMKESVQLIEALNIAEDQGMDVVEVSETGKDGLPVCKILDYGKMMYEKSRKKKNKKQTQRVKEIKYSLNIDPHDLNIKHDKILKFLSKKYIVKYVLELSGRQKDMANDAVVIINKNLEAFKEFAKWNKPQVSYGRRVLISTTLSPI